MRRLTHWSYLYARWSPEKGTAAAQSWLSSYAGDFEFLLDVRASSRGRGLSTGQAKGVLNCMLAELRRQAKQAANGPGVTVAGDPPLGWFALGSPLVFVAITKSRESGKVHVKQIIGGNPDQYRGTFRNGSYSGGCQKEVTAWLALDEAGRTAAMAAFGREIGKCGVCGRTLTDELSRGLGIGPVCRS